MSNNRPSKRRYKAMLEDVEKRIRYAMYSGEHTNPYPVDDKRHDRFTRQLFHAQRVESDFNDMCDIMGTDQSAWVRRHYSRPGLVVPVERLI